jgi:hypothetical protein
MARSTGLPIAVVVPLIDGETVHLEFDSSTEDVLLVIEQLEETRNASSEHHAAGSDVDAATADAGEAGTLMCRSSGPCSDHSDGRSLENGYPSLPYTKSVFFAAHRLALAPA